MNKNYLISGFADEIDQDLTTQIENLQKLGMHYVEMRGVDGNNLIYHSDAKVKEIKERLDAAGIALSALGSPLGKIGIEDPFEKHFEEFKRAVEIAHRMKTKNIRMFSFYIPEGKSEAYKSQVFDRLGQFVDYAAANDAVLLHENEKDIYGEKAKECQITDINNGNIGVGNLCGVQQVVIQVGGGETRGKVIEEHHEHGDGEFFVFETDCHDVGQLLPGRLFVVILLGQGQTDGLDDRKGKSHITQGDDDGLLGRRTGKRIGNQAADEGRAAGRDIDHDLVDGKITCPDLVGNITDVP